ncbi:MULTISPECIES: hypothetical protein [Xanthomonas]|uniref:Uncharacterized protein n=1 Tax=Xanthomonas phaseoli pv. dieffenbachiae TaxID=92828 RepID=A0A1V9GWF8_9XANT|nr:hypothetical protein [Xanthomonas phaseoli]MBO9766285.1 hypothetical protein [Xanthomonas phaseoli pv. dieffenbachiae]MBO9775344.1 hypothetical protein [Xanthomonas phaseoli pv. dieffenbachiae]MBO9778899.1 hypothetical protein [Xanthomonas phaseoli pv. dieffenbachiae]MBO9787650.1 hypothetical protein [Xanthomonas phaseoli pv. dieffenbachiae]MBO9796440.1 hypothetical protein [Xanthomonas phaseoli pv. dieffenbachiae]
MRWLAARWAVPQRRVARCTDGSDAHRCIEHQFIALRALLVDTASMRNALASNAGGALQGLWWVRNRLVVPVAIHASMQLSDALQRCQPRRVVHWMQASRFRRTQASR